MIQYYDENYWTNHAPIEIPHLRPNCGQTIRSNAATQISKQQHIDVL